jgi:hypothetical protein
MDKNKKSAHRASSKLKQNSDLKNKVLISHQISDESSENFIRFNTWRHKNVYL